MYKLKLYTFNVYTKNELESLRELESNLDSLGVKFTRTEKFYNSLFTTRPRMFYWTPQEIANKLRALPWNTKVEEMEEDLINWIARFIELRVDFNSLSDEEFKDLDDYIKLFIENNFKFTLNEFLT